MIWKRERNLHPDNNPSSLLCSLDSIIYVPALESPRFDLHHRDRLQDFGHHAYLRHPRNTATISNVHDPENLDSKKARIQQDLVYLAACRYL
jgi:hypothetical protein